MTFAETFQLLSDGLALRETAFATIQGEGGLAMGLTIFGLGALSKGLGEAGILFINRVSRAEFVRSLVGSVLILAFTAFIWAGCIWLSCRYALGQETDLQQILNLVLISYTPLVFAFLAIVPHVGLLWHRMLMIWSLLIVMAGLHHELGLSFLQAVGCSALGWLVFYLLTYLFGSRAEKIRLRLLGREDWVKPKEAAVALLVRELEQQ